MLGQVILSHNNLNTFIIYLEMGFLAPQDSITGDKIYIMEFWPIFK